MTAITRIDAQIHTATDALAGTDGDVYIGIGGREFNADSSDNDFEPGSNPIYTFGDGHNVLFPDTNDPRNPQLDTADVNKFPVYVRFEPPPAPDPLPPAFLQDWHLASVTVTVNPGPSQVQFSRLIGAPALWLGQTMGKVCYLKSQ